MDQTEFKSEIVCDNNNEKPITWAVQSLNIEGLGLEFSFVLV